jgi:methionyl-tRNA synthetase
MPDKKYFYITTPIYYASANLHIGHAYCEVITDSLARYKRERGYDVFFLTGADEHGQKIAKNAENAGMEPQAFVDMVAENFKKTWKSMMISNDDFIRTTDPRHVEVVQKVFTKLLNQGDIYLGKYEGWYCTSDEAFWTDSQVGENHICPSCGRPVHKETEEAYFLNCKKYIPQLLKFYEDHPDFVPDGKLNEMINTFIKPGLEDLCITRTSFSWGVPTKEDPKHIVYVWIDALLNYISALGYLSDDDSKFQKFWGPDSEIVHFVGREINRFHTIYWPIMLMALGLRLPDHVYVHGLLLTRSGVKLSKSLGNAPAPQPLIDRYGLDSLRYYMVREIPIGEDGTFTPKQFVDRINMDLVNSYGNLLNRTLSMIAKYFGGIIPEYKAPVCPNVIKAYQDMELYLNQYESEMDAYDVTKGADTAINLINVGNKLIEVEAPWVLAKDPYKLGELQETMYVLAEILRTGSLMLKPFLVIKADEALNQLNVPSEARDYQTIRSYGKLSGVHIGVPSQLFPRLDKDKEMAFLADLIDVHTGEHA